MKLVVVLHKPQQPGNIGAVARVMGNFGLKDLVLIKPSCDHLCLEARQRAKHSGNILKKAKVVEEAALKKYATLVATTAVIGRDTNIARGSLTLSQLTEQLKKAKGNIALLFGNEADGLPQTLLRKSDLTVTIPTSKSYPTLNLSHAVALVLYELSTSSKNRVTAEITPASQKDKDLIMNYLNKAIDALQFSTKDKKETQRRIWKKVFGKAFLTKREAVAVMGFLRKIQKK